MEVIAEKVKKFGICPVIDMGLTTKYEWWMDLFNKPGSIHIYKEDPIKNETTTNDKDKDNKEETSDACNNNNNTPTCDLDSNDHSLDIKENESHQYEEVSKEIIEPSTETEIQEDNSIQTTKENNDETLDCSDDLVQATHSQQLNDSDQSKDSEDGVVDTFLTNDQMEAHSEDANENHKPSAGKIDN